MSIKQETNSTSPVVLITGSAQRIGSCLATTFHQAGYRVIIHYNHSKKAAKSLCDQLNTERRKSSETLYANLGEHAQLSALANNAIDKFGRLDVLINNASVFHPTPVTDASEQDWDNIFKCNVKAPFFLSQQLAPSLALQQGCIINIVDIYAERPLPQHSVYNMSKAALKMMTLSLAQDLAPNIRVNGISPGAILWPDNGKQTQKSQSDILDKVALGVLGTPQSIADTAIFLAQKETYITGQIIAVDGGRSLNI